jgi:Glycosyl hydrolase 109, C-terminal domain/Oxidoreductase family, NAD-binding Rossmann fold
MDTTTRRDFLKTTAVTLGGAAVASASGGKAEAQQPLQAPPETTLFRAPALDRVRVGFVGVGGMGTVHLGNYLSLEGVELKAVCDIDPSHAERARKMVVAAGQPEPTLYTRGDRDFERMCGEEELDLVFTATPWEWHIPVMLAALKTGKHAATEVPAAYRVDDCWALVEAAEKYRKHAVMMENCCYDRREMLALMLVRKGLLGELLHAECGYLHDLRSVKFSTQGEGLWRRAHAMRADGNHYPTHGLGPVAQCLNINRGNQFDFLVSMSSPQRGLTLYAEEHLPPDDPRRKEKYKLGDVNATLIQTVQGQSIYLAHNCDDPRPYSRINLVQGTRGLIGGWPDRVYIEGRSPKEDAWEPLDKYYEEFEHPLWKSEKVKEATRGHGGMDFLEDYRFIECLRAGVPADMNVYDAAALSVICELTDRSVADRSRPQDIPDFTRGRWKTTEPLGIVES